MILMSFVFTMSCERTSFMESTGLPSNITVRNLSYPSIVNARAYSAITTSIPTMDSDGVPCGFTIVSVRSEADGELPPEYLDAVGVSSAFMDTIRVAVEITEIGEKEKVDKDGNPVLDDDGNPVIVTLYDTTFHDTPLMNPNEAGKITIADGNMFGEGDYHFTLAVTPITDSDENTQVFRDAFHLNVMPLLPIGITYEPVQQNLVIGTDDKTVTPTLRFPKDVPSYDVRFELTSDTDKVIINGETGEISLNPEFTITKNVAFTPSIKVISNVTEEEVDFEGKEDMLTIVISSERLILNAGPLLPPALIYMPYAQNLVAGGGMKTTDADVSSGNPSVTFSLETEGDKLVIDEQTGEISINPAYTLDVDQLDLYPVVKVTSLVSYEERLFENKIRVVLSKTAVTLPKTVFNFFYPSMVNKDGFTINAPVRGGVGDGLFWKTKKKPTHDFADAERPAGVAKGHSTVMHNLVYEPTRSPLQDSWMVMDAQNLTQYDSPGYDTKAIFWYKNDLVLYLPDGSAPADIEIYITSDYTGDVTTTEWTQVNDKIKFTIEGTGTEYTGTPYPGNNLGEDPEGKKDPSIGAYEKWLRCELDLADYTAETKFTLAFRYKSYYEEEFVEGVEWGMCSGRFVFTDVNYRAEEK